MGKNELIRKCIYNGLRVGIMKSEVGYLLGPKHPDGIQLKPE